MRQWILIIFYWIIWTPFTSRNKERALEKNVQKSARNRPQSQQSSHMVSFSAAKRSETKIPSFFTIGIATEQRGRFKFILSWTWMPCCWFVFWFLVFTGKAFVFLMVFQRNNAMRWIQQKSKLTIQWLKNWNLI